MNHSSKDRLDKIKAATVAIAAVPENAGSQPSRDQPFVIIGSGFSIHPQGVIVTCAHVVEAFMEKSIKEYLDTIPDEEKTRDLVESL